MSGPLAGRIAEALELPIDYFREFRRDYVVQHLDANEKLLEDAYEWVRRRETSKKTARSRRAGG